MVLYDGLGPRRITSMEQAVSQVGAMWLSSTGNYQERVVMSCNAYKPRQIRGKIVWLVQNNVYRARTETQKTNQHKEETIV